MKRFVGMTVMGASLVAAAIMATSGIAAPGKEDSSFGTSRGHTVTGASDTATPFENRHSVALNDGSFISAEMIGTRAALTRRAPDGTPSAGFGKGGTVLLPYIEDRKTSAEMVTVQGNSVIALTAGQLGRSGTIYLQRFSATSGKRDKGFGNKGTQALAITSFLQKANGSGFLPIDIEVDRKNRIYVAARMESSPGQAVLIRLTRGGKLDMTFWQKGYIKVFRRDCQVMHDMAVTRAGVFLASRDCIRLYEEDGKLDESFDYQQSGSPISSLVTGPGGSMHLTLGNSQIVAIERLNPDGSRDRSFGNNGKLNPAWPDAIFTDLSIDEEGRLILSGSHLDETSPLAVARYSANGTPDLEFAGTGYASLSPGQQWSQIDDQSTLIEDGLIVRGSSPDPETARSSTVKVLANGSLDGGYGSGGVLADTVAAPPDDRTVETISTASGGTLAAGSSGDHASLIRYLANGRVDRSFGDDGWVRFRFATGRSSDAASAIARTADGSTVVCVNTDRTQGAYITRVSAEGTVDLDFGESGRTELPDLRACSGISVTDTGRILVAGTIWRAKPVILRLDADGSLDETYGEEGSALGAWSVNRTSDRVGFLGFRDGSALIATPELMTRFNPDGERVTSFGNGGVVKLSRSNASSFSIPVAIRLGSKGTIFMGSTGNGAFALLKIASNGEIVRDFGNDGLLKFKGSNNWIALTDFLIQPDGKPVVTTSTSANCDRKGNCYEKAFVNRFTRDGELDRKFGHKGTFSTRYGVSTRATSLMLTDRGIVIGGWADTYAGREESVLIRLKR